MDNKMVLNFTNFINEARKNPDQNPKISAYESLKKYKDDPDIYISFTDIKKVGIKPLSNFNTPLGIYTYPLKEMWQTMMRFGDAGDVPFAGKRDYIFVLRSKNKKIFVKDLYTDYTSTDFDRDMDKLRKMYKNDVEKFETAYNWGLESARMKTPSASFWNITRLLTNDTKSWNVLLRKLGYTGFADKSGKGIIHPAEPMQAIFLSKDAFTVEELLLNKKYKSVIEINKNNIDKYLTTILDAFQLEDLYKQVSEWPIYNYKMADLLFDIVIQDFELIDAIKRNYYKSPIKLYAFPKSNTNRKMIAVMLLSEKLDKKHINILKKIFSEELTNGTNIYDAFDSFRDMIANFKDVLNINDPSQMSSKLYKENITLLYNSLTTKG